MEITSSKQAAKYIAVTSLLSGLLFLGIDLWLPGNIWMYLIIPEIIIYFLTLYFISGYLFNHFVSQKITPLYKTIHNRNISGKELRKNLEQTGLISDMRTDVVNWVMDKTQEIDQLKQLEKYRREFLGNVSHELKTPIFNIQGYILTLLDGGLDDPSINRVYLQKAEKSINRMINIVEDLESISRLESGELKLEFEFFDIVSLVGEVFELQEMLARQHQIKLSFGSNADRPIKVYADKKRITELLNNLVVNSIKYGRKSGKTKVSFTEIGEQVIVEVTDTGIGIAAKDIPRIFERFYRTDKSRSRDLGGTGLGLSIVKHIIEAHEQTITVQSTPGEGSTFSFTLSTQKPVI